MRTAFITDYAISWAALSPILRRLEKFKITFNPMIKLPYNFNINMIDYLPSLAQYGIEESEDPDCIIYLMGKEKKYYNIFKHFFNKNKRLFLIKIDEAGNILNDQSRI